MVDTATFAAITALYLVAIAYLGYLGYKKTRQSEDYMVCGRRINPVVLAFSYGATFISTSAIVGFGGVAALMGMGITWLTVLTIGVGVFVAFVVYGKKIRRIGQRTGAITFPDLFGKMFGCDRLRVGASIIILLGMPLYTAAILIGGAHFINTTLGIGYESSLLAFAVIVAIYVIGGGLIAVMYTDAMQGAIMFCGMLLLLVISYIVLGGVSSANQELTNMSDLVPAGLAGAGMTGWTSMPVLGSSIWWTLISTIVLCVGVGVLAQPQLSVRFMTVSNDRALNRGVLIGGLFVLVMLTSAFTIGALSNVYFWDEQGQLAVQAAGNMDAVIPLFINSAMPEAFVVVFMLALLAAAMSTLSSLFHNMGTTLGYDLYKMTYGTNGRRVVQRSAKRVSQLGAMVMIVISVVLAFQMPPDIIARATAMFMGLCAVALLPSLTYALYTESPRSEPAVASLAVGAGFWLLWTAFVHQAESSVLGLTEALFGVESLAGHPWDVMNPIVIGLPLSALVLVAVHLWLKRAAA